MAIRPHIDDFDSDIDYLIALECYGLELEAEEEARMCEMEEDE